MMVLCNASIIIQYHTTRPELPNAPVDMEYDINRTEEEPPKDESSIMIHVHAA